MNNELLIVNIKQYCSDKGIQTTFACNDAGVGKSFLSDVKRGKIPSVAKVQLLAQYLGVTTCDLLGEKKEPDTQTDAEPLDIIDARLMELVRQMSPSQKQSLIEKMEFLLSMRE